MHLSDDDTDNEDYQVSEEDEDNKEEEGRDDILVGNLDPANDFAMPPHRQSVNVSESRPSTGMPSSSGTPRVSFFMGRREKRKERDPMASVLESLSTMMAESQRKHDLQMAELSTREERERMENLRLQEESRPIQMENS